MITPRSFEDWSRRKDIVQYRFAPEIAKEHAGICGMPHIHDILIVYPDDACIVKIVDEYCVTVGNLQETFYSLHDAEKFLWENYSHGNHY